MGLVFIPCSYVLQKLGVHKLSTRFLSGEGCWDERVLQANN